MKEMKKRDSSNEKKNAERIKPKKKRGSFIRLYTPSRLKDACENLETPFRLEWCLVSLIACLTFATIGILAFHLKLVFAIITIFVAIFFSIPIMLAILDNGNEHKRFEDLNSYLQQYIAGMTLHKRIAMALQDTIITFPDGQMHKVLSTMLKHIETSLNVKTAQREALSYLEEEYPNSQSGMIHDFSLRVEERGGEFEDEMHMLNEKREKWENRTEELQNKMRITVVGAIVLYIFMVFVCYLILRAISVEQSGLDIKYNIAVQICETGLLSFFYLFVYRIERKYADGWLEAENLMNKEQANKLLDYLDNWDVKVERKKGWICGGITLVATAIIFLITKQIASIPVGIVISVIAFNIHYIIKKLRFENLKTEIKQAMPRWLFDVCLLLQKYNIAISIEQSMRNAPPILLREIDKLEHELKKNPTSVEPFMNFLKDYHIDNVATTMRMLVSIQKGSSGDSRVQVAQLIDHNMNMLDRLDKNTKEMRSALTARYNAIATVPAIIVTIVYLAVLIIQVFTMATNMI